jgi:hypothetical protein
VDLQNHSKEYSMQLSIIRNGSKEAAPTQVAPTIMDTEPTMEMLMQKLSSQEKRMVELEKQLQKNATGSSVAAPRLPRSNTGTTTAKNREAKVNDKSPFRQNARSSTRMEPAQSSRSNSATADSVRSGGGNQQGNKGKKKKKKQSTV